MKEKNILLQVDLCHSIGLSSGLNSIHFSQQHYGRSSMRCSADDASPWWGRLYDVTANSCTQLCWGLRGVAAKV